ncbi:MAG: hypothetical protein ACLTDO_02900 [Bifidobacterium pseudocatenulatum]
MADENNSNEDGQFVPDGSMEPLSPQEADNTDYGLMVGERIQKKDLQQEMRDSYLAYAMSVIVDRALPDVRDGMKPVHRRGSTRCTTAATAPTAATPSAPAWSAK